MLTTINDRIKNLNESGIRCADWALEKPNKNSRVTIGHDARINDLVEDALNYFQEADWFEELIQLREERVDREGLALAIDTLLAKNKQLKEALGITRGQWIDSINAKQCLAALND